MSDLTQEQVVDYLSNLSVLDLANLVKTLEDSWGVDASAAMAVAAVPGMAAAGGAEEEEQTEFNVVLTSYGEKKIKVIKVVREVTDLGLKEAKELVEGVPATVKEGLEKDDAQKIIDAIAEVGGVAEMK